MSMRALVLLISLLVTGDAGAAVNAPPSIEPRGAEPREDLFASKPRSAAPAATPALPAPPRGPGYRACPDRQSVVGDPAQPVVSDP